MIGTERPLNVPGEVPLSGTLHLPAEAGADAWKRPAILFIHGSGPVDRNESARFIPLNVFNSLAEEFGNAGYASFRYDKRGVGESKGSYYRAGLWDLVDDAARALVVLKSQKEVDPEKIVIVGHSEGCYIAPLVAQRIPVAGMVLLMAPADRLDTILLYQAQMMEGALGTIKGLKGSLIRRLVSVQNGGSLTEAQERLLTKVRRGTKPVIRFRMSRVPAKWVREHMGFDPSEAYSSISCPVLIVNGSQDLKVRPADARTIAEIVKGPCEWHILEGMTHILRRDPRDGPSVMHYKKLLKESVDPEIPQLILGWLHRNLVEKHAASPSQSVTAKPPMELHDAP